MTVAFLLTSCGSYSKLLDKSWKQLHSSGKGDPRPGFRKLTVKYPAQPGGYQGLAACAANEGHYATAVAWLGKARVFTADPVGQRTLDSTQAAYLLAHADKDFHPLRAKDYEQAIPAYITLLEQAKQLLLTAGYAGGQEVTSLNKQIANAYLQAARLAVDAGRYADLYRYGNKVLTRPETSAGETRAMLELIATGLKAEKEYARALYFFRELSRSGAASGYEAELAEIYLLLARQALAAQDPHAASAFLEVLPVTSVFQKTDLLRDSIYSAQAAHEVKLARAATATAAKGSHYRNALFFFSRISRLAPVEATARNTALLELARLSTQDGKEEEALEYLNRLYALATDAPARKAVESEKIRLYYLLAQKHHRKKEYVQALDYLQRILAVSPDHPEASQLLSEIREWQGRVRLDLGLELLQRRQYEQAEYFLLAAGEAEAVKGEAGMAAARLYQQTYLPGYAVNVYETMTDTRADAVSFALAQLYAVKGEPERSRACLERLYLSASYLTYAGKARTLPEFYNLRDDLYFRLWSNGLQRWKLQLHQLGRLQDKDRFRDAEHMSKGTADISDPYFLYIRRNKTSMSEVSWDVYNKGFDNLTITEDYTPGEKFRLILVDYDKDNKIRSWDGDDLIFSGTLSPFGASPRHYKKEKLYHSDNNGKKFSGELTYSLTRVLTDKEYAGWDTPAAQLARIPDNRIFRKSVQQLVVEATWELVKSRLSFPRFLMVTLIESFLAQDIEPTLQGVQDKAMDYFQKKFISASIRRHFKTYHAAERIVQLIKELQSVRY